MRILLVLAHPIPSPSAAWRRVSFFAEFFKKKGSETFISGCLSFTSSKTHPSLRDIPLLRTTYTLPFWKNPLVFILNSIIHFVCLSPLLLWLRPDIVIVSVPPAEPCIGLFITTRITHCKFIVDYRDQSEDYLISLSKFKLCKRAFQFIKSLLTAIYIKSELVTAVTPNIINSLKQRGITNVKLMPNGADITVFKPLSEERRNKTFSLLYSGGVGGYYRLDVVIKALKILVEKGLNNISLTIAGLGEMQKIVKLAEKLGIPNHIKYIGIITDQAQLANSIAKADVGIIPYDNNPLWKNSIPAKFYEYCACGIPVIATTYSDSLLAKIIRSYKIGITSPPFDEEKLAEAILWLYKNKSFREAAGKRARKLIEEKFDRSKIAEEYLQLIKSLTQSPK